MDGEQSSFGIWRRFALTVVPLLALMFGSVAVFGSSTAEAAVSASLGVSCSVSSSGGVTTVRLNYKINARSSADEDISNVTLEIAGTVASPDYSANPLDGTKVFKHTFVTGPVGTGVYDATLTVTGDDGNVATTTSRATVTVGPSGASCRHQSPAPTV